MIKYIRVNLVKIVYVFAFLAGHLPSSKMMAVEKNYLDEQYGIIANLETQTVLRPNFNYQENFRIMPLGDSITAGVHRVEAFPGSYRIQLSKHFRRHQLTINWVGSLQNDPLTYNFNFDFDNDHEGHGGWKISQIKHMINNNLFTYQKADVVLLMIGTNDFLNSAMAEEALNDLEALLHTLKIKAPEVKVFVSDIPPINPQGSKDSANLENAQQVKQFNAGIAEVVSRVASANIVHVTVASQLDLNEINSDGVHPTPVGYDKIGNIWYNTLMRPEALNKVQNLVGSDLNDKLMGNRTSNMLAGKGGDDWLRGTSAAKAGAYEQDVLSGGTGADRFILGDTVQAYYSAAGDDDVVRLVDFDPSEDIVQLHGIASDYEIVQHGNDVYLKWARDGELIAIFENTSVFNLSGPGFKFIKAQRQSLMTNNQ